MTSTPCLPVLVLSAHTYQRGLPPSVTNRFPDPSPAVPFRVQPSSYLDGILVSQLTPSSQFHLCAMASILLKLTRFPCHLGFSRASGYTGSWTSNSRLVRSHVTPWRRLSSINPFPWPIQPPTLLPPCHQTASRTPGKTESWPPDAHLDHALWRDIARSETNPLPGHSPAMPLRVQPSSWQDQILDAQPTACFHSLSPPVWRRSSASNPFPILLPPRRPPNASSTTFQVCRCTRHRSSRHPILCPAIPPVMPSRAHPRTHDTERRRSSRHCPQSSHSPALLRAFVPRLPKRENVIVPTCIPTHVIASGVPFDISSLLAGALDIISPCPFHLIG